MSQTKEDTLYMIKEKLDFLSNLFVAWDYEAIVFSCEDGAVMSEILYHEARKIEEVLKEMKR